jgi:hypothetical protein
VLKWLVAGYPSRRPGFEPGSGHVGFVVDKAATGQVFSENVIIRNWYNRPVVASVVMGSVPLHPKKERKVY